MEHENKSIEWVNEYRVIWVNSDYEIQETFVEAESKKKAIIEFFTAVDSFDVENFKVKKVK
jgi:phosphoglycerate dehydrogenase-like enzyme